jgi:hypothetical protein
MFSPALDLTACDTPKADPVSLSVLFVSVLFVDLTWSGT